MGGIISFTSPGGHPCIHVLPEVKALPHATQGPHRDNEGGGNAAGILQGGGEVTPLSQRLEAAACGVVELAHARAQDPAGAHIIHERDCVRVDCQRDHTVQNAGHRQAELEAAAFAIRRLHPHALAFHLCNATLTVHKHNQDELYKECTCMTLAVFPTHYPCI